MPTIGIWPTLPPTARLRGGTLIDIVWHPGEPDEQVVVRGVRISAQTLEHAQRLHESMGLLNISDSDAGTAAEASTPLAEVAGTMQATVVEGAAGPPGVAGGMLSATVDGAVGSPAVYGVMLDSSGRAVP